MRRLLRIETDCRKKVYNLLQKRRGKVSLTADTRSSPVFNGYIAVTVQWVDTNWDLKSTVLQFKILHTPHTGNTTCLFLKDIIV